MKKIKVMVKKVFKILVDGQMKYPVGGEFGLYRGHEINEINEVKKEGGDYESKSNSEIKKGGRKGKAARAGDGTNASEGRSFPV